jgi:hypothetical protein
MKLENGYKLIYEVVKDGRREFRASQTGVPADNDYLLMSNEIGANKLVYEYKGKFYGTGDNAIPTYNENGIPVDTALISDEAFAEVFVAKEPVEVASVEPKVVDNEGTKGTEETGSTGDDGDVVTGDEK